MSTPTSALSRLGPLTFPFAALGLVGGALAGHFSGRNAFDLPGGHLTIALFTTLVAGRLGHLLSRAGGPPPVIATWWGRVIWRSLVAGGLNSVLLFAFDCLYHATRPGSSLSEPFSLALFGTIAAWLFGAAVALPFLPSMVVVAGMHWRAERARPRSLARALLARRTWLATCVVSAVYLGVTVLWIEQSGPGEDRDSATTLRLLLAFAMTGAGVLTVLELEAARALRRALRAAAGLTRHDPRQRAIAMGTQPQEGDLGAGEGQLVSVDRSLDPYRALDVAALRFTGDPTATTELVRGASWWLLVAIPLACAPAVVALARELVHLAGQFS